VPDGYNGRFIQQNTSVLGINQGVGCTQINSQVSGKPLCK